MGEGPLGITEIANQEHIDFPKTGDNIAAKRVALYGYYPGGSVWNRLQVDANGVVQTSGSGGGGGGSVTQGTIPWQSSIYDGTSTANVLSPGTPNSSGNALLSAPTGDTVAFTTGSPAMLASTDVGNYKAFSVFVGTQGVASTVAWQGSNDNTNWFSVSAVQPANIGSNTPATSTTSTFVAFAGGINFRYFRINVTGITSGTTAGTVFFSTAPYSVSNMSVNANIQGTWAVGLTTQFAGASGTAAPSNAALIGVDDGTNLQYLTNASNTSDSDSFNHALPVGMSIYNGTNYSRLAAANRASGTTGTGLLGVGELSLAAAALPTATTATNYVRNMSDKFGRQVMVPQATRDLVGIADITLTSTTSPTTLIAAGGTGILTDIVDISIINTSATATEVDISDGTNTYYFYLPAGDMRGATYQVPCPATTTNTAWTATTITSVASVKISVKYIKNQ